MSDELAVKDGQRGAGGEAVDKVGASYSIGVIVSATYITLTVRDQVGMRLKDWQRQVAGLLMVGMALLCGCRSVPQFPNRPMRVTAVDRGRVLVFDTNKDRRGDYEQLQDQTGRKVELRYRGSDGAPSETVRLDEVATGEVPHFIILADGVPYGLVEELYEQGLFRLFYRPSRLISCFPSMTDLAFSQVFDSAQPLAYQAEHFDRDRNRLVKGGQVYLGGENAGWIEKIDYHSPMGMVALAYLKPQLVFDYELWRIKEVFSEVESGTVIAYSTGTAGLGTHGGRELMLMYLRALDRLCEELVYKRHGRVKITLLADHGHGMAGRGRVTFEELLGESGYRLQDRLGGEKDVVTVEFGLVNYAAFFTDDPAEVATALLRDPVVTLACYRSGDTVVVRTLEGKARIRKVNGRFGYEVEYGDPLELRPIIEGLRAQGKVDEEGLIDDRVLFEATAEHVYPDGVKRVWQAFNGLVQKPADLVVCLQEGWCHGRLLFDVVLSEATSAHGSLNRINSTTFLMSMWGEFPQALRMEEVMGELERTVKLKLDAQEGGKDE